MPPPGKTDDSDGSSPTPLDAGFAPRMGFFRFDSATRRFHLAGATGFAQATVKAAASHLAFRLGEERGLVGWVAARRHAHYVADVNSEPRWIRQDPTIRSAYLVPIVGEDDGPLGVLVLMSSQVDGFTAEHRALADLRGRDIAAQLGMADRLEAQADAGGPSIRALAAELRRRSFGRASPPDVAATGAGQPDLSMLSARELEVAGALRRGLRVAEVARVLSMSVHTVRNHLKHINAKLNVHSQVELLAALEGHARKTTRSAATRTPLRVLYVEDNAADVDLMRRELARAAPHVSLDVATSISHAKSQLSLAAEHYDAALIDLRLPDGNGLDLVRELRAGTFGLPIVVLTGSEAADLPVAALQAGANDYWVKTGNYLARSAKALDNCIARFRSETAAASEPLRVLYAEQDIADASLTLRRLGAHARHITLDIVRTHQALLDRLPTNDQELCVYDVLLIDHRSGTADALDLLKTLRDERGLDLPVVVVSRTPDIELATQSLRFGATDYLVKTPGYLVALPSVLRGAHAHVRLVREQTALRERGMELRKAEGRFRVLFDKVAIGVAQVGAFGGRFLRVNPKCREILGYSEAQLTELDLGTVTHPDDREAVLANLKAIHDDDLKETELDARWLGHDGGTVWVNLKLSPMWLPSEPPTDCVMVVEDISERWLTRNVQEILATNLGPTTGDAFYAAVASEMATLFGVAIGFVGRLIEGSPARVQTMAMSVDGVLAGNVEYETSGPLVDAPKARRGSKGAPTPLSMAPTPAILASLDVTSSITVPLLDVSGKTIGVLGVMSRTAFEHPAPVENALGMFAGRAAAELVRQQTESRFHALFEFFPDAVLLVDERGGIVRSNRLCEAVFGYTAHELEKMSVDALVPDAQRSGHSGLRHGFTAAARPRPMAGKDLRARKKDGTLIRVEIHLNPMQVEGRPLVVTTVRDVTDEVRAHEERRQLEHQVRQTQRLDAVGTLASGIAHDINNLLGVISMGSASARAQLGPNHPGQLDLEDIGLAVERATALVRRILTFSRETASEQKPLVVRTIVDETAKLLRATVPANVRVSVTGNDASAIHGDATQIHQVLMNLCTNAWHALDGASGQIGVCVERVTFDQPSTMGDTAIPAGCYVHITVSDTGKGMDSATQERMFEPFFTTKAIGHGTGLGLSVVHGIVRAHEGVIAVESALGHGTRFHMYFPALTEDVLHSTIPSPVATKHDGEGLSVLLVDDEPALLHVTTRVLTQNGHRVTVCTDGVDALRELRTRPGTFDVVLCDQNMPVMSGVELAGELHRGGMQLPFVLTSGHVTNELRLRAALVGVSKVLQKPLSWSDIRNAIDELIPPDARPTR